MSWLCLQVGMGLPIIGYMVGRANRCILCANIKTKRVIIDIGLTLINIHCLDDVSKHGKTSFFYVFIVFLPKLIGIRIMCVYITFDVM